MSPNELLLWMSARQRGSWAQFRSMVDDLGLRNEATAWSYQRFRFGLTRHGHTSFVANGGGLEWSVVPPFLSLGEIGGQPAGVLCGARTSPMLAQLNAAAPQGAVQVSSNSEGADAIRIFAPVAALEHAAAQAGIAVRFNVVREALARIRPVEMPKTPLTGGIPFGRDVTFQRFVREGHRYSWQEVAAAVPTKKVELFRCTRWQMSDYYLFVDGRPHQVEAQCGKFLVLRDAGRQVVRFNAAAGQLRVPARFRPPLRLERALTLCSGLPPVEEYDAVRQILFLNYGGIPPDVAGLACEILHQPKP